MQRKSLSTLSTHCFVNLFQEYIRERVNNCIDLYNETMESHKTRHT